MTRAARDRRAPWIYYGTCDEDAASELRALEISDSDHVMSVTGSGCRSLSLVSRNPRSVLSVDAAVGQSHLLTLKLAAIHHFSYDTVLSFLGVEPCGDRLRLLDDLRDRVGPEVYDYFRGFPRSVQRGLIFSGRHERIYTRLIGPWMRLRYRGSLARLVEADTLDEQRTVYAERIDSSDWRWLVRYGFSERALRALFRDAGYNITVDIDDVGGYVLERMDHSIRHQLVRDNDWLTFMLTGRYRDRNSLPHYLERSSYEAIRAASTVVQIETGDIVDHLRRRPPASIDKFSLSDVTSCIDRSQFAELMREVVRAAAPDARICYRNFLAKHRIGPELPLCRDDALSDELTDIDKAFIYDLEVLSRT